MVVAEKKLDYRFQGTWSKETAISTANPLGRALPGHGGRRGGVRFMRHRGIPGHALARGQSIPGTGGERAEVKTWEALALGGRTPGVLARLEAHLGRHPATGAQPGLDGAPAGQGGAACRP